MVDENENSSDSNRRDFLKALGATGIAGAGFAGSASASTPSREIVEITGSKAKRLAALARRDGDFRAYRNELNSRPGTTVRQDDYRVFRSTNTDTGETWHAVDFVVDDGRSDTVGDVAVTVQDGATRGATAAITRMEDGHPVEVEGFELDGDAVVSETVSVPGDVNPEDVSAMYSVCDFCKDIRGVACAVGCGVGTGLICALMFVTVVGGVACSAVAAAVCYFIGKYGCSYSAEFHCILAGYC